MFKFKGISSKEMKVVCEEETNFLKKSSKSYDLIDEDLNYYDYGLNNVSGEINLFILDKSKLDGIFAWLDGSGVLEYKERVTNIAFFDVQEPERSATIYQLNANFIRSPLWYKKNDDFVAVTNEILNEGNAPVFPILRLEKGSSETMELKINDVNFSYTFPENEDYVEIDCRKAEAIYDGGFRNLNLTIGYEFPKLHPGSNRVISETDGVIKVKRKDAWL